MGVCTETGAGNESRTRDLNLGKVALYQLSYSRGSRHYMAIFTFFQKSENFCCHKQKKR